MAKTSNYETDIGQFTGRYTKFMVSRIIDNPLNQLLELEIPTTIPENFTVELNFYSLVDNSLISSLVLDSSDEKVFSAKSLIYSDENQTSSNRRLLFIDFSNVQIPLVQGRYQVVFNFFIPEIGKYNEPQLMVMDISPSRKEVELRITPEYLTPTNINSLVDFGSPRIADDWVLDVARQIFNQPASATSNNVPTDNTNLTFDVVQTFLPQTIVSLINNPSTSTEFTNSVKSTTQLILDRAYGYATQSIAASGSVVYTNARWNMLIQESINYAVATITTTQTLGGYNIT